jgi:hypothetical protein
MGTDWYEQRDVRLYRGRDGLGGIRAQLVHPQLAFTEGWTPSLMADDYYEHHQLTRALLTYLVTSTTHEEYKLVS